MIYRLQIKKERKMRLLIDYLKTKSEQIIIQIIYYTTPPINSNYTTVVSVVVPGTHYVVEFIAL
jgi:hypothetical protein